MRSTFVLVCLFISGSNSLYAPRKLTISEVRNNTQLGLEELMVPTDKEKEKEDSNHEPFDQPAKGTNMEPGIKDSIRL